MLHCLDHDTCRAEQHTLDLQAQLVAARAAAIALANVATTHRGMLEQFASTLARGEAATAGARAAAATDRAAAAAAEIAVAAAGRTAAAATAALADEKLRAAGLEAESRSLAAAGEAAIGEAAVALQAALEAAARLADSRRQDEWRGQEKVHHAYDLAELTNRVTQLEGQLGEEGKHTEMLQAQVRLNVGGWVEAGVGVRVGVGRWIGGRGMCGFCASVVSLCLVVAVSVYCCGPVDIRVGGWLWVTVQDCYVI